MIGCCDSVFGKMNCTYRCWNFAVCVLVSLIALVISILGLSGVLEHGDSSFYTNLVIFITGVWCPTPAIKSTSKQDSQKPRQGI